MDQHIMHGRELAANTILNLMSDFPHTNRP